MATKRSTIWIDANGNTYQTIVRSAAGSAAIEADCLAVSNASRQDAWEGLEVGSAGSSTAADYQTVGDYALLYYLCNDGTIATLRIPAPQSAIFLSDQQTVDAAYSGVVTLNAAVIGTLLSASGSVASSYLGGARKRVNRDYV